MKANAPEKIYISPLPNHSDGYVGVALDEPHKTMVEYIRTNAFIEKACEFLKSYRQDTYDGTGYIVGIINDKTIEDFKNYMKGENE